MVDTIAERKIVNLLSKVTFTKDDILKEFSKRGNVLEAMIATKKYSLTALIKRLFRNSAGEPLELLPFQSALLWMLWSHKYPMVLASRGAGKTFIYAVYALLRAFLIPGSQICIVGAGFRQAKLVFQYIEKLYYQSPLVQEAISSGGGPKRAVDQCALKVGSSNIFAIPLGDGERIRGMRANVILCDEFASIPEEIFEIVVQPFAAVHSNPARQAKITAIIKRLKHYGAPNRVIELLEAHMGFGNQICVSGTATYQFNHFYRKWAMYNRVIASNGDMKLIEQAFSEGNKYLVTGKVDPELLKSFNYKDYAIFQLPYHAIPEGFMDAGVIANARLQYEPSRFNMEYLCKFAKDSDGFYKRSVVEAATPKDGDNVVNIELFGEPGAQYVMGIDPARQNDNFAIVVLKLTGSGYKVVYCWSMRSKEFDVAVRKIRDLMRRFNIVYIAMDQGGGGMHVYDLLHMKELMGKDEEPIWRIDDDDTKHFKGLHILDLFQWSNEWIRDNNHAMRAEIAQKILLFPDSRIDSETIIAQYAKFNRKKIKDVDNEEVGLLMEEAYGTVNEDGIKSLDGIFDNIEEMKNELCAIVTKVSENGTEQFILPPLSVQEKNQSLTDARRRDRYSALLLAAYAARITKGHGYKKRDLPGGSDSYFRKRGGGGNIRRTNSGTCYPVF